MTHDLLYQQLADISHPLALLTGLFAHAPVPLQIYRADGYCLLVNDAFRTLFGAVPPPGYNVFDDNVAESSGVLTDIRRAFQGEVVHTPPVWYDPRELKHVSVSEGHRVAIEATFFPLFGADGVLTHVAVVFADRTAERLAEERARAETVALAESEELFRVVHEVSPNGFSFFRPVHDASGAVIDLEYVFQNEAAARVNRLPSGHAVAGTRMLEAFPALRNDALWGHYKGVAETGAPWRGEVHYAGEHFNNWFQITSVRAGNGVALTFEDITARKAAEAAREAALAETERARARLYEIFTNAPAAIAILSGPTLAFEFANPRFSELFGPRAVVGKSIREVAPELEGQGFFELLERVRVTGVPFIGREMLARLDRRGAGVFEDVYFTFVYEPSRGTDGLIDGVLVFAFDVTDLVTARQRAEALATELAHERTRLATVLDHVPIGVVLAEAPSGRIALGNAQVERILRHPVLISPSVEHYGEWAGRHADGRAVVANEWPLARALEGETTPGEDFLYERGDGSRAWIRVGGAPIRDETGTISGAVVAIYDVDREKRLEAERERLLDAARAGEEHLRTLVDTMPLLAWYANPDGTIPWYNRRWLEYTGATNDEHAGWGWEAAHDPADVARVIQGWSASLASGEPWEDTFRIRRHDGVFRWFLSRAIPLRDAEGRIVRWFGTNVDIDDQKRAEAAAAFFAKASTLFVSSLDLATMLDGATNLVVPERADGCCVWLIDDEKPMQLAALAHVDVESAELWREMLYSYPESPGQPRGYDEIARTGDAELVDVVTDTHRTSAARDSAHGVMLRDLAVTSSLVVPLRAQGRPLGVLSLIMSSSGRHFDAADVPLFEELGRRLAVAIDNARLFDLAQRERRRAEEANRAKDEFLAIVSHELRSPLNAMLGWARMLRSGNLDAERHARAIDTIERNAHVQTHLIEDLLDISRITTGKLRLHLATVTVGEVVTAALDTVRPAADAKAVRLQMLADSSAGPVLGDADRLQQVVWNLVANAVKFTPKGGRVTVRVLRDDSSVQLVVEDTGVGIAPEFLPYVFERFRQADTGTTRAPGGLGLGLAIVKHLVELHGGTIEAYSAGLGHGTSFVTRLPVVALRSSVPPVVESSPPLSSAAVSLRCPPELAGLRVLVVDDEQDARDLLRAMLEQCRVVVECAASAADALASIEASPPDILVSDVGMPVEDGYALLEKLRRLPAMRGGRIPAIALTAFARMEDRTRALLAGFDIHIAKPVDPAELLAILVRFSGRVRGEP